MPTFVQILDFIGTFAFAISGIRLASAKRFDWFGAYVVGLATAIGGGTIRDVCRSNRMVATKQDRLRSDRRKKRLPAIRTESLTSKSDSQKRGS